jgi:hypothetical protein
MTEHDDLIARLQAMADAPVDEAVAERHLAAMGGAIRTAPTSRPRGRLVVAGALVTGSLLGTGAMAGAATGALPAIAQDTAHTVMAKVGVKVPKSKAAEAKAKAKQAKAEREDAGTGGTERFTGDGTVTCTNVDGTPFTGNHGQYVSGHPDDAATTDVNEREVAAQSPCGKPLQAGNPGSAADEHKPADAGKPANAGKSGERTPPPTGKPAGAGKPDTSGKSNEHKPTTKAPAGATED